jgi:hypothetical protein
MDTYRIKHQQLQHDQRALVEPWQHLHDHRGYGHHGDGDPLSALAAAEAALDPGLLVLLRHLRGVAV